MSHSSQSRTEVQMENYSVGDEVLARWEGSKKYFKATVTKTLKTQKVQVLFDDGTAKTIALKDLKTLEGFSPPRRPSRSRKSSPEKRSRRRSTSRGRSKSPTRSPSRKLSATPPSPRSKRGRPSVTEQSPSTSAIFQLKEVAIPLEKVILTPVVDLERRYPTRRKVLEEPAVSKKETVEKTVQSVTMAASHPSKISWVRAFLAFLVVLFMSLLPPFLYLVCNKNKGVLLGLPDMPRRLSSYVTPKCGAIFLAWVASQLVLALVPLGKKVPQMGTTRPFHYRMNGLLSVVSTVAAVCAVAYYRLLPLNVFWENQLQFTCCAVLFSFAVSIFLFAKSFYHSGRLATNCGNFVYDFCLGRELNPRLWETLDLKLLLFHLGFTGWVLVDSLLLYKYFGVHACVSYPMAATITMQTLYIVATLWREETLLATATFLYDGVGCAFALAFGAVLPFVYSLPILYLTAPFAPQNQPTWLLALAALTFVVGLALIQKSLSDKYAFKSNPFNPALSHMETIPKDFTRCLISSGVWGIVRHPNYLGEILVFLAWTLPCGFASSLPYVPTILVFSCLVLRSLVQESAVRRRHGHAWVQYTTQVRYRLIPGIF